MISISHNNKHAVTAFRAFSLIELVVVIAVIAILAALLLPASAKMKSNSKKFTCLNNCKQMGFGQQMFAADHAQGKSIYSGPLGSLTGTFVSGSGTNGTTAQMADDDLNWLHGVQGNSNAYVRTLQTFVCPATINNIRENVTATINPPGTSLLLKVLVDLSDKATDKYDTTGHSYEVFGFWHTYNLGYFPRKTLTTVQNHLNNSTANMTIRGSISGPSDIFTILDRVEAHAGINYENTPNRRDGHGVDGANVVFTDGHGEFILSENWYDRYHKSEDDSIANNGHPYP